MGRISPKLAFAGIVLAAVVCGAPAAFAATSPTAAQASGPNLNGRFAMTETITSLSGDTGTDYVGETSHATWTFSPSCKYGSCRTTSSHVPGYTTTPSPVVVVVNPSGAGSFNGSTTRSYVAGCYSNTPPYAELSPVGEQFTETLSITVSSVSQGAAQSLTGTLVQHWSATPAGAALQCNPATVTYSLTATAVAGTVLPAVPPPSTSGKTPKHHAVKKPTVRASPAGAATGPRSSFASTLTPISKAFPINLRTLIDALITLAAMLLITFPAQLFNRTLDENYDEIRGIARRRVPVLVGIRRALRWGSSRSGIAGFVAVMLLGAILGGIEDPAFGFNARTGETLLAVLIAFAVMIVVAGLVGLGYRSARHLDRSWALHALPAGLVVAAVCVVVSRLTNFEPGYLYGVIAGLAFSVQLGRKEQGHDAALASLSVLVVAVVAWALWTPVSRAASHPHPSPGILIADTLLGCLFVSGIVSTVINLVPLRFLSGGTLFKWHRGVWAFTFALALFLLVEVMLLPAARADRLGDAPFVTTAVLFAVFGAVSISFHQYFAQRARRTARRTGEDTGVVKVEAAEERKDEAQEEERVLPTMVRVSETPEPGAAR
jgi:hypothetical protein